MMNIKQIILLSLVSFCYQASHCLQMQKTCNLYNSQPKTVSHCILVRGNQCLQCEENYSVYNDGTKCVNIPNCRVFDEEEKCESCAFYYNFDSNGNCVKDYCLQYDSNKNCIQCYPRFQLNSEKKCEKINIDYCLQAEGNTCISCAFGTKEINGNCKIIENFIEGCKTYNNDETACTQCEQNYELNNGKCTFTNQCQGLGVYEMCLGCDDDSYIDSTIYQCKRYDGVSENSNTNTDNGNNGNNNGGNSGSNNGGNSDSNNGGNSDSNNGGKSDNKAERINFNFGLIYLLLVLI